MAKEEKTVNKTVIDTALPVITKGMQSAYSHYTASPESLKWIENFIPDTLGQLTARPPVYLSDTDTAPAQSTWCFNLAGSGAFFTKVGTSLKIFSASIPHTVTTTTTSIFANANSVARFDQVAGVAFCASYGDNVRYTTNGTTFTVPTGFAGMGTNNDLVNTGFDGRVWATSSNQTLGSALAGQIFYSDVLGVDPTTVTMTNVQYLLVNTKGFPPTALVDFDNVMYVFTANSIFRVYNVNSLDNSPVFNVGAIRQEAVVKAFDSVFFMHTSGMYQMKYGRITKISIDIDDLIRQFRITSNSGGYQNVFAWFDNDAVYWSVDLGPQYGNNNNYTDRTYVLRYNYKFQQWSVLSFYGVQINCAAGKYLIADANDSLLNSSPSVMICANYIGTSNYVYGLFDIEGRYQGYKPFGNSNTAEPLGDWTNINADNTNPPTAATQIRPIYVCAKTQWLTFGAERLEKEINGISVAGEQAIGFNVSYQNDLEDVLYSDKNDAVWNKQNQAIMQNQYMNFFQDFKTKRFYRIRFMIQGTTLGRKSRIGEITILKLTNYSYGEN